MKRHYRMFNLIYYLHAVDQKVPFVQQNKTLKAPNVWNYCETGSNLAMNLRDKEDSYLDNISSFLKYLSS